MVKICSVGQQRLAPYSAAAGENPLQMARHQNHDLYHQKHELYHHCRLLHQLALGDRFGLFIQTLNNAEKLFIQIIHSIETSSQASKLR